MARLNNDAREILFDMVTEKAKDKREKLLKLMTEIDDEINSSYKERVEAARKDIELMIPTIDIGIDRILTKHRLGWSEHRSRKHTFEDIFENGDLKKDLREYFTNCERKSNRRALLDTKLKDLDARVSKAKQEILLRTALGMKYDEVVAIINSFQF